MRTRVSGSSLRALRTCASSALAVTLALGAPLAAALAIPSEAAASDNAAPAPTDLQSQAQEIASQIAADAVTLDQLDAAYNAATIRYQQLTGQEAALAKLIAQTANEAKTALQTLKQQAVLAYIAGGGPEVNYQSGQATRDPSLTLAYAEIVADGERSAATTYKASLAAETGQQKQLVAATHAAAVTLADVHAAETQARSTVGSRQQVLSQVKGQLATAVAAAEASDQQTQQQEQIATLTSEGQLPPASTPAGVSTATRQTSQRPAPPAGRPTETTTTSRPRSTTKTSRGTSGASPPTTRANPAPTTTTTTVHSGALPQAPGVSAVYAYAQAQIGKPYQFGAAGPGSFDCSGLVMRAWEQAGIYLPRVAQDQYNMTERIPLSQLEMGDLVFFANQGGVYHVGIYVGGGNMIDAPTTGEDVKVQSIYWTPNLMSTGGRVTVNS